MSQTSLPALRKLLVASNLWVGIAAGALSLIAFERIALQAWHYAALVCFATAAAYCYMRWIPFIQRLGYQQDSASHNWFRNQPYLALFFTIAYSGLALYFFSFFGWSLLWLALPALLLALVYPLTFPRPFSSFSSLRRYPGLKLILISTCWAYVVYLLPLFLQGLPFGGWEAGQFIFRVTYIAALTIPFDVRDQNTDPPGMRTLPQIYGATNALAFAGLLIVIQQIFVVAETFLHSREILQGVAWLLGLEISYRLVQGSGRNPQDYYVSFWVEGAPVFLFILIWLAEQLRGSSYFWLL